MSSKPSKCDSHNHNVSDLDDDEVCEFQLRKERRERERRADRHVRKFGCPHCDQKFFSLGNLAAHIVSVHANGARAFECNVCGVASALEFNKYDHMRRLHPLQFFDDDDDNEL